MRCRKYTQVRERKVDYLFKKQCVCPSINCFALVGQPLQNKRADVIADVWSFRMLGNAKGTNGIQVVSLLKLQQKGK